MDDLRSLILNARSGDLDAYATIVRRFQGMAYGYAYSILGDFHLAEDAAQEAFFEAYRKLPDLRTPDAFAGWFRRIVFKYCDRLIRGKRISTVPLETAGEIVSDVPRPDEIVEKREMRDQVMEMIRSLPENERMVTTLFYIDGYSQKEVAEFLEVPVTTVKSRLHTSRIRLRERMLDMVDETLKSFPLSDRFADVVKQMNFVTKHINPLADRMCSLQDKQISEKTEELRRRLAEGACRDAIKAEAFALVREASRRALDREHYDIQLVAGMILDAGWIAEMSPGEGKSIACYPSAYMAVLEGMRVHIAMMNDYLAKREAELASKVFSLLGATVGYVTADMPARGDEADVRRCVYRCDITYGSYSEFGFDHLRDGLRGSADQPLQGSLDVVIIDEVDSVLLDEARTPLIVSGREPGDVHMYHRADAAARELIARSCPRESGIQCERSSENDAGKDTRDKVRQVERQGTQRAVAPSDMAMLYEIDAKGRWCVHLTDEGMEVAQELAGVGSFGHESNAGWPQRIERALRAHLLYQKDREYVVRDDQVILLDGYSGRLTPGRRFSAGLHQAIQVKEGVEITPEIRAKATLLIQDYFRRYRKLAGITGTAMSQAEEFRQRYNLEVAAVPTRRPLNRVDHDDRVYVDMEARYEAIIEEIRHYSQDLGRPVLVGTTSIEESERISEMLSRRHAIGHQVLDARPENAAREAAIIASAGQQHPRRDGSQEMVGAVTIATQMAGRGTEIELGPGVVYTHCQVPPAEKLAQLDVQVDPLFSPGTGKCCTYCTEYDEATHCAHCFKPKIDPSFSRRGRTDCRREPPCGLHVVGLGRHPVRRIDNQLRNRSGRQGDPGSSRFFLSLEDELMGDVDEEVRNSWREALEHKVVLEDRRISEAVRLSQEKVEHRNLEIRRKLDRLDPQSVWDGDDRRRTPGSGSEA